MYATAVVSHHRFPASLLWRTLIHVIIAGLVWRIWLGGTLVGTLLLRMESLLNPLASRDRFSLTVILGCTNTMLPRSLNPITRILLYYSEQEARIRSICM